MHRQVVDKAHGNHDEEEVEDIPIIDVRQSIQKGSFLPVMALLQSKSFDPATYIVDPNTGAKPIHYSGHFGKLKFLKTLVEVYRLDPSQILDQYNMTVAHYAARSGELPILIYLARVS